MKKSCALCGAEKEEHALVISEHGQICETCELDTDVSFDGGISQGLIMAALFAVAPFFFWYVTGTGLSSFGVGARFNLLTTGQDHVAFFGGLIGVIAGGIALKGAFSPKSPKMIAASIICMIVGFVHILLRSGYLY